MMEVSIHALLAESDRAENHANSQQEVSIHALLAESDAITSRLVLL